MEAGQMVLLKLRVSAFAGTRILGALVSIEGDKIKLKDCCAIHDFIHQNRDGSVTIRPTYMVNNIESEGTWTYHLKEDVSALRLVDETEEMLKLYDDTFARYKAEKAGLSLPQNLRPSQPTPRV